MERKRRGRNEILCPALIFLMLVLLAFCPPVLGQGADQNGQSIIRVPDIPRQNNTIYASVHLIDLYNFEYQTGHYTYDMYVAFFWTDPDISTADWYLMNGYPSYPGAKLLVDQDKNGSVKWELYRVRADFTAPIEPTDYPFDHVTVPISIELLSSKSNTSIVWLSQSTGIGNSFTNVGWTRPVYELRTSMSHYPLGIDSPRADMIIVMDRYPSGAFVKTIFPPLIFCFVAAICFLFRMYEPSAFSLRVGITTSMLVSAVLFLFAEQSSIPPVSQLTLFHAVMISVICFLALGLVVTIFGYVEWMHSGIREKVDRINRAGFIITLIFSLLVFVLLYLAR
jgi:hypothetical protein